MKLKCLEDLLCPDCQGELALDEAEISLSFAQTDPGELQEGLVACTVCQKKYPVICGVLILVKNIQSYVSKNLSLIITVGAQHGISEQMLCYWQRKGYDFHDTGYQETFWENALGISIYIAAHYDKLLDILPPSHPLNKLIKDYSKRNFYSVIVDLVRPRLEPSDRALDIGCNVGGLVYRLADLCGFVYGIDTSFRAVLTARRILIYKSQRMTTYRLYKEGLTYSERPIPADRLDNVEIIVASGFNPPFRDQFDLVTCANVMDAISEPSVLIDAIDSVLKQKGLFLTTDPYFWSPTRTPISSWIGQGMPARHALIDSIKSRGMEILNEQDDVLWLLRVYDRFFSIWINHCLLARKDNNHR